MKNLTLALVLALTFTGAAVSQNARGASAGTKIAGRTNALPIPTCPWNDPTGCGIR